ncbi:MAG TPA: ribokinase [Polyangiaceae bacterium]|nr:ribokinase [Polyangiaceae bacterium]
MSDASSESDFDVVVVGSVNTDYTVTGPRLPTPGTTITGSEFRIEPGGKGANQALAAVRLGARAALLARVGGDERGAASLQQLRLAGVDTSAVSSDARAVTGAALVMVAESGEKQILTAPGANHALSPAEVSSAGQLLARTRVVLLQLEIPMATAEAAARLGRAAGARVVLDAGPAAPLSEELLRDVHLIRANSAEAEVLTGVRVDDTASARRAAKNLLRRGAGAACVGAPGGNLLLTPEQELWLPHITVRAVDATGAGDALSAGLAAALAQGMPLDEAARLGHAAAALKTTKPGAQAGMPLRAEVLALLQQVHRDGARRN